VLRTHPPGVNVRSRASCALPHSALRPARASMRSRRPRDVTPGGCVRSPLEVRYGSDVESIIQCASLGLDRRQGVAFYQHRVPSNLAIDRPARAGTDHDTGDEQPAASSKDADHACSSSGTQTSGPILGIHAAVEAGAKGQGQEDPCREGHPSGGRSSKQLPRHVSEASGNDLPPKHRKFPRYHPN